ncbi:MAG: murein biosynthesis integral membrane protein MurJ [Alphaproteobacteria bacterium]|nr:murein biosynthesis integral membrane protein MurJ [Alphaproteobacteria bacterium]
MSIRKHFLSVSAWTSASRVLGFIRDVIIASLLGAGRGADIFFAAFKLPNMFRSIFGEGALHASFVPMFVESKNKENFANQAFSWLLVVTLGITIIGVIAMPLIMLLLAPGFAAQPGKLAEAIHIARIMFPYMLLICVAGFMAGILNAANRFALAAAMPAMLNIFLISGALIAVKMNWNIAVGLSVAVLLSGLVQVWILWSRIRKKQFGLRLVRLKRSPDMKTLFKRMVPGIVGSGAYHINIMVGTILASLTPGAVSWLYYADRLVQLPFAIVGIAMGTVLLTSISKAFADKNTELAHIQQNRAITHILFWTLPAFAGLAALAEPIVRILFQRGAFTNFDTMQTSNAIMILACALPAMNLEQVFEKTIYASKDTKTPVKISMIGITLSVAAALLLFPFMGFLSIVLGVALSAWFKMSVMARVAYKRGLFKLTPNTLLISAVFAAASVLMFSGLKFVEISSLFDLIIAMTIAGGGYLGLMRLFLIKLPKQGRNVK